jgi:hypothetical protein
MPCPDLWRRARNGVAGGGDHGVGDPARPDDCCTAAEAGEDQRTLLAWAMMKICPP